MRTCVLFTLAFAGLALLTDDASAFGRKKRGGGNCCNSAAVATSCGGCGSYGGYGGAGYGAAPYGRVSYAGSVGAPCNSCGGAVAGTTMGGYGTNMIQPTSGTYYTMPGGVTTTGWNQPYYGNPGVYPAGGYSSGYYGAYPAQTMPGVNLGGVNISPRGITVPGRMP